MTGILNHLSDGAPSGTTLLLIHPMGADLTFWDAFHKIVEPRLHCVAVDLRGAGTSVKATAPLTIEGHAGDLEALVEALGLTRVVPVGCAVGAMVAALLAARRPDLCDGLVLSNPSIGTQAGARDMLARRAELVRKEGIAAVLDHAIASAFTGCADDERRRAYAARFAAQDRGSYAFALEGMLDADIHEEATRIECPTLIVGGGLDGLLPPDVHARPLHDCIKTSELVVIADAAHFVPYQRPQEFAALVADFVARRLRVREDR